MKDKTSGVVMAAGGIVTRDSVRPLVGIVRLRKDKSWVLPKGKLKRGESLLDAAAREVEEETGHSVTVAGYLGALSHVSEGRHKMVQFWHMQASPAPVRPLMKDVSEVKWLPLSRAVEMLTREQEKVFLSHVGPAALKAAEDLHAAAVSVPTIDSPNINTEQESTTFLDAIRIWFGRTRRARLPSSYQ
jgi:8-oxo-dGTP diphosphatase